MNDIQEDRNSMFLVAKKYLGEHAIDFSTHPKIAPAKVLLDQLIQQTSEADARAIVNMTGVAEDKAEERVDLEKICFLVSNAANSYGRNIKDRTLEKQTKYEMSDFEGMRDSDLDTTAQLLKKIVEPIIGNLADDRLYPADLVTLETERQDFINMLADPAYAKLDKIEAGTEVDELQEKTTLLLVDVDAYVNTYRFENTALWRGWYLARKIITTGGGGGGADEATVFTGTLNPFSSAKVTMLPYNAATPVKLESTGADALSFSLTDNGMPVGSPVIVSPGSPVETTLGDMGPSGTELLVQNNSASPGSYKVTIG